MTIPAHRLALLIAATPLLLAGCSDLPKMPSLWPFGDDAGKGGRRLPADAQELACAEGKRFALRYLDNGAAAWVIFPEREFRLEKQPASESTRYGNGRAVLDVRGEELSLADGYGGVYAACKRVTPAK